MDNESESTTTSEDEARLESSPSDGIITSVVIFVLLCVLLVIPILQLAIGTSFQNQCPVSPNISTYLIVSGACGIATIVLIIIMGNVWVFRVHSKVDLDNPLSSNYCQRTLYQFAFTIIIMTYVISVIGCCCSYFRCCNVGKAQLKSDKERMIMLRQMKRQRHL
ncbi:unnamed protein product [Adineta steineri]|uniref:Uncharacterized protein n=1 Tax=Adineta steineri TaxID=433720 RepID=A0A815GUS0_9BILA|nr:unnamed protein product [Adineta steineri]CAF1594024.1 unnamed protein product [Adineta steineri]